MGETTEIGWTTSSFNPWWGCTRVSDGCQHCYAEAFAKRTGKAEWGKNADRRFFGDAHWNEPLKWERKASASGEPWRVFCASMADVFEDRDDLVDERERLLTLISDTPHLTWQLLTKRPENVRDMVFRSNWIVDWPPNAWIGTTVEHQAAADERVPILTDLPAPVRFLSVEPMLGPVDLSKWLHLEWMDALRPPDAPPTFRTEDGEGGWGAEMFAALQGRRPQIEWVIVGGESGPGHRPLDLRYARDVIEQCNAAEVPVFFKQVGGRTPKAGGDEIDGRRWKEFPA